MKNTALSKSKYTKHCQCPKALWLGVNNPAEAREALLAYCHLDTLAMVRVWEKLKVFVK
ncbi:MAG: hypothetical protein J6Q73_08655 [Bacteroidaceae bacterium]|nr:hypothetical protein [Bacteroidaceae bacterium]